MGTIHISHVETGNSVPSVQLLVDIIDTLDCSADDLLCIEIKKSRPVYNTWISTLLSDCSSDAIKLITDTVIADSMWRLQSAE